MNKAVFKKREPFKVSNPARVSKFSNQANLIIQATFQIAQHQQSSCPVEYPRPANESQFCQTYRNVLKRSEVRAACPTT